MKGGRLPSSLMMIFFFFFFFHRMVTLESWILGQNACDANKDLEQLTVLIWVYEGVPKHNLLLLESAIRAKLLSLNWHWPVGRINWLFFRFFFFTWICGPLPSPSPPPLLLQYSFSPLGASWERWAQTAGLVKDPSWDADNVFAHSLPCSPLASASLIRTPKLHQKWLFVLKLFFPPFVELFLSAIPLIQRKNESQVGQDNAAAGSVPALQRTDSNMEEPQGCLNMPSGLCLSHCLNGWKWVALLQVFYLLNANQFQGLFE